MVHFTFKNGLAGKSLSAHNSFKSFIIMVVMLVMTTSSAFAEVYEVIDGLQYKLDAETKTAELKSADGTKYSGNIVVPKKVKDNDGVEYSVTSFGSYCFERCTGLTSITIPSSVTEIGDDCFYVCTGLTSITIPSSVQVLYYYCFYGCTGLTSVTIPSSVTELQSCCFEGCTGLTSITIPSSVKEVDDHCFEGCFNLTSITIPSSVESLDAHCFSYCENLASIYFKGKLPSASYSSLDIPKNCVIKVPAEYLLDYKKAFGPDYKYVPVWDHDESGDNDNPSVRCATPIISYVAGRLKFSCDTEGAKYYYSISDKDMATDALSEDGNVLLSAAYNISAYATADGYITSKNAEATLYWINAFLENVKKRNLILMYVIQLFLFDTHI